METYIRVTDYKSSNNKQRIGTITFEKLSLKVI
jgi:hypothetical protein